MSLGKSCTLGLAGLYGGWGFYNGFNGTSHFLKVPYKEKYYTDRTLMGVYTALLYVGAAPCAIFCAIKKIEGKIRGLDQE